MHEDRVRKLEALKKLGINPFPEKFSKTHGLTEAKVLKEGTKVSVAGRLMTLRDMGRLAFAHLQDFTGRMQIVFEKEQLGEKAFELLKLLDLGDFLGVHGKIFTTKKGEISVLVESFQLLAKALRPLPEKWHGLKDKETAYRQRYLDLMSNRESMDRFIFRFNFIKALREFYWQEGFLEVETPVLQSTASGALAKPFSTHHNALDHDFFLRIALEIHQKEATVGGFEKIFEIGKVFRNEGIDPSHLQEFLMCEHYAVYWNFEDNMRFTEKMFHHLLEKTLGSKTAVILDRAGKKHTVDFGRPWKQIKMKDLIKQDCGIDIDSCRTADKLRKAIQKKNMVLEDAEHLGLGNLIDALYKKVSRPKLIEPTFLTHHPVELSPLARRNDQDPTVVDRFQLVVSGWEIVNAYSEVVDPQDQAGRFEDQSEAKAGGDEDAHSKDDEFVIAMEHGMPPQSGWGMGIDRIVALLTQQENVKDVVMFPLMKPLEQHAPKEKVENVA